ncbi:MAG: nucleoside phosphorylase [Candidatus Pacearchaeota archaeon]
MTFPQFKNKHLEKALFSPLELPRKKDLPKNLPKKSIIVYSRSSINYIKRKYKPKKFKEILVGADYYKYKDIAFIRMKGIGSPHAITAFEEMIHLGMKTFLNIGTAGGLQDFGIFLCDRAIRDEGTSHHYLPCEKYSYPDKNLSKQLEKSLIKNKLSYQVGTTWTIDAPYRETIAEIKRYQKENVKTVEMEVSALFAVAKLRGVKIASAFAVSDLVLPEKWIPHFKKKHVKDRLNKLIDAAVDCLKGLK